MAKYLKGAIIRKKLEDGTPIGPYMQIMHVDHKKVYADVIGLDVPNVAIPKKNVYLYRIPAVIVSEQKLQELKEKRAIAVRHKTTANWEKILKDPPELIKFFTVPKNYQAIFVVDSVRTVYALNERSIQIVVGNKVL